MKRRQLFAGILTALSLQALATLPAFAATYVEQIVSQLRAQGFENIEVERTWLGRTRIGADRGNESREIVLNPNTGEILRDLWQSKTGAGSAKIIIGDDKQDDNSGQGSGDDPTDSSGHGSGGSETDDDDDKDGSGNG